MDKQKYIGHYVLKKVFLVFFLVCDVRFRFSVLCLTYNVLKRIVDLDWVKFTGSCCCYFFVAFIKMIILYQVPLRQAEVLSFKYIRRFLI